MEHTQQPLLIHCIAFCTRSTILLHLQLAHTHTKWEEIDLLQYRNCSHRLECILLNFAYEFDAIWMVKWSTSSSSINIACVFSGSLYQWGPFFNQFFLFELLWRSTTLCGKRNTHTLRLPFDSILLIYSWNKRICGLFFSVMLQKIE